MTFGRFPVVRVVAVALVAILAGAALAGDDPRGWTTGGVVAKGATRALGPMPAQVSIELPPDVAALVKGPTLLVYFSPTCPHCQAAAPELAALAKRAGDRLQVLGVASGRAAQEDVEAFRTAFGWEFPVVRDANGKVASAMRVQATPSALLVKPGARKKFDVVDVWYPYRRGGDVLVMMRILDDPWQAFAPGEYQGNVACATCHIDEADAWALTHHSIAWKTVVDKGKQGDPECTRCHVIGQGQPTGYAGEDDSILVDVGCEACHGPGGPHDGTSTDAKAACAGCHDDKHAIGFSVDKAIPLIDHYKAVGWDEARWQAAREDLVGGKVERELVGFQGGETAGSAACATCHAAETAQWQAGPHAHAMARLAGKDATDVGCVRCHATAKAPGPAAADVASFRVDEAVGCEACHGPGKEHVDSGGKTAMEGLGDDCPVCVIEALCTSCHTPEWDKSWSVDAKLPLVGHGVSAPP